MYDYLPWGQVSYVGILCKELLYLRKHVYSLDARVMELKQPWEAERFIDEAFMDIVEQFHHQCNNPCVSEENESLGDEEHQGVKEGNCPLDRTHFPDDFMVSTCTKDILLREMIP